MSGREDQDGIGAKEEELEEGMMKNTEEEEEKKTGVFMLKLMKTEEWRL